RLLLFRLPHVAGLVLATWANYAFFDVRIPAVTAVGAIPLVLLVASLPITPQGVGTRELFAIQVFVPFAARTVDPRAAVVAAGAGGTPAPLLPQALVEIASTRPAAALLGAPSPDVDRAERPSPEVEPSRQGDP